MSKALTASWEDVWLLDGVRTPFVDYNGALAQISPIDLGIKAAREVFARSGASPEDVGTVITGNMAQASFDAYLLPRHIGLYAGVPIETPAHMVQRVCGTGIEVLMQAADNITHRDVDLALCVGTESMSRNPVASYTSRGGFRMGQVEFKDFLWEALADGSCDVTMGRRQKTSRGSIRSRAARLTPTRCAHSSVRWRRKSPAFSPARSRRSLPKNSLAKATIRAAFVCRATRSRSITTRMCAPRRSSSLPKSVLRSAVCRPAAIRRRSSMARPRRWSRRRLMRKSRTRSLSRASSQARPPACHRDHGHRPGAGDPGGG